MYYIVFQLITAYQGPTLFTGEQLFCSSEAAEPALGMLFPHNPQFISLKWNWNNSLQHEDVAIKKQNQKGKRTDLKEDESVKEKIW